MAASSGGAGARTRAKDSARAAMMKSLGIVRMTQRCPLCYKTISCDSTKSKYVHVCKG